MTSRSGEKKVDEMIDFAVRAGFTPVYKEGECVGFNVVPTPAPCKDCDGKGYVQKIEDRGPLLRPAKFPVDCLSCTRAVVCEKCKDHHYICSASGKNPCTDPHRVMEKGGMATHDWIPCPSCQPKGEEKPKSRPFGYNVLCWHQMIAAVKNKESFAIAFPEGMVLSPVAVENIVKEKVERVVKAVEEIVGPYLLHYKDRPVERVPFDKVIAAARAALIEKARGEGVQL